MKNLLAITAMVIAVGVPAFIFGRLTVPQPKPKPPEVSFSNWEPIRIGLHSDDNIPSGSKAAVRWLEAEHAAGRVVGRHGSTFSKQFGMARSIGIGSNAIEIELLYDKGEGRYGILTIDPKTGVVVKAKFGEYES